MVVVEDVHAILYAWEDLVVAVLVAAVAVYLGVAAVNLKTVVAEESFDAAVAVVLKSVASADTFVDLM